jgi:hypothetical protein
MARNTTDGRDDRSDDPSVPKYHKPDERGLTGDGGGQGGSGSSFYPGGSRERSGADSQRRPGDSSSRSPGRVEEDALLDKAQHDAELADESGDASSEKPSSRKTH